VVETFGGKGAVTKDEWWQVGGVGLEGNFASNTLVKQADLVLSVGTRLTDFATGSQSIFDNADVRFASLNIVDIDTRKQGATGILADARLGLEALSQTLEGYIPPQRRGRNRSTPRRPRGHPSGPSGSTPTPRTALRIIQTPRSPTPS
jgi:TPP-dependent trihydroxycyclohexane-1,2-dione (THcHDO) dehydratase